MKTPLSPAENAARLAAFVAHERERLLRVRGRRAVLPLVHKLILLGFDDLAVEVLRVGEARGVTLPEGRTATEQRALLAGILAALRPCVTTYTTKESAASSAFFDLLAEWLEPTN